MADIFLSYAREDRGAVEKLVAQLEAAGLSCWWDRQLTAGAKYRERTEAELNAANAVLVVWTRNSITSHWVEDEAAAAVEAGKLAPVTLDSSMPPLGFRQFQVIDFSDWKGGSDGPMQELVTALSAFAPAKSAPTAPAPSASSGQTASRRFTLSRRALTLLAGVAAAVVLLVAAWAVWGGLARKPEPTIAVLPFANVSEDRAKDYLAHGLASELIEVLSGFDRLKVISRSSSFSFSATADARAAGQALQVANILTGTVNEEGGHVRISIELVDTKSGRAILSKTYTPEFTTENIASTQRFIAEQVAGALSVTFEVKGGKQFIGSGTRSMAAYDFYLRGLELMSSPEEAEALFAQSVAADANYAAAWGLKAISHGVSSWTQPTPAQSRAVQNDAYAMAQKAVMLDPTIGVAQAVFANLSTTQHKWNDAETASRRALDLSRTEITLNQRQLILLRAGRLTDADALSAEINQVSPRGVEDVAVPAILAALGRLDQLRTTMDKPEWVSTTSLRRRLFRLEAMVHLGAPAAVRKELEAIADLPDRAPSEFAKAVLAVFDNKEKARKVLRAWYEGPGFETAAKYELIPILAAWYGDTDLVARVWRDDLPLSVVRMAVIWGPAFAPARSRPDFKALMQDIGLVDYWRANKWADKCRPIGKSDFECG